MGKRRLFGAIVGTALVASLVVLSGATPAAGAGSTVTLSAEAQMLAIGGSAELKVSLSHNANPVVGSTIEWMVLAGPDIGTGGSVVSDGSGEATFSYSNSGEAGVDQLRAKVVDPDGDLVASEALAVQWVASIPSTLELIQTEASSPVGTQTTVTAVAKDGGNNPVAGVGVVLQREGIGPLEREQTDAAGQAQFDFTYDVPGEQEMTAELSLTSPLVTATLTKTWTPVGALVPGPDAPTAPVGAETQVSVTATDAGGSPVAGAEVTFTVKGANPTVAHVTADGSGVAVLAYSGTQPGVDAITASFTDPDANTVTSPQMLAAWVPPAGKHVVLTTLEAQVTAGTVHTFHVVAGSDGAALPGADTSLHGGSSVPFPFVATTDARGLASFSYGSMTPQSESFTASFDDGATTVTSDPVVVEFVKGYDVFVYPGGMQMVGTEHTTTVAVTGPDRLPVVGAPLDLGFMSLGFPNSLLPTRLVTDATGLAHFTFVGFLPGAANPVASLVDDPARSALGSVTFVESGLTLTPPSQSVGVGSQATITATLALGDGEVSGVSVGFQVMSGPNAGLVQTVATDSAGNATLSYVGEAMGIDTIIASALVDGAPILSMQSVSVIWNQTVPVGTTLALSPESAENPVGTEHTVVATLLDGETPLEGVEVSFDVSGANATSGTGTTDAAGQASFTYTGAAAGTDSIVASATVDGTEVMSDMVTKTWTDEGPGITLALSPESADNPVGTQHTVTATLLDGDAPVEGVEVSFEVSGANATSGTGTTDAAGQASFTYFGDLPGTDTIVASVSVDDTTVESEPVTKTWVSAVPAVVQLMPATSENPVGTDHTVDAIVTDADGLAVPGIEVTFTVTAGPHAGTTDTSTTSSTGTAQFTYTGTSAGTDTIVASITWEGTTVESEPVTKTWVAAGVSDGVHLKALWGPAGHRSLAYENGGTLTAGDYVVDPTTGEPTSIDGTGTLPSSSGDGDATIAFHLVFDEGTNKWGGTVEIDDPGADFTAEIPVFAGPQRITRDGDRIEGTLYGIKRLSTPEKCFELHFKIDDGNASGEEPVEEVADGHLRIPARWAHHTRRHPEGYRNARPAWARHR